MICRTRPSGCGPIIGSTRSEAAVAVLVPSTETVTARGARCLAQAPRHFRAIALALLLAFVPIAQAEPVDPEIARMLERALQDAEQLRKQLSTVEYDATMRVQEWDGRGRLRGTAKATAIMRPGDAQSMIFTSREVEGKVRLPEPDNEPSKKEEKDDSSLHDFARDHQIAERFTYTLVGSESTAAGRARHVRFEPKPNFPAKSRADKFLNNIRGSAWISEETNKLVKFEMRMLKPFQLFWIFAVLKDLKINYELLAPGEIVGRSKLKVLFSLNTPVYSIRQQHDVELDNFRRRSQTIAAAQ